MQIAPQLAVEVHLRRVATYYVCPLAEIAGV